MTIRRWAVRASVAATAAVMSVLTAACGSATPRPVAPLHVARGPAPHTFISLRTLKRPEPGPLGFEAVVITSADTGAIVRRLLPWGWHGMQVRGLALDRSGNLWVTYSKSYSCSGPAGPSNECTPEPGTCGGRIMVLHAATGTLTTFLRASRNVQLWGAAPNPAGTLLAYRESGCVSYLNGHLRVASLRTHRSWTIGAGLGRCHLISSPAWSADGRDLVAAYAPAPTAPYAGPQETCSSPRRERLVEVSALKGQPGMAGRTAFAAPGCEITSAAPAAGGGAFAVEACGRPYWSGPARLLVLSAALRTAHVLPLGRCADGTGLATSPSGRSVLVSAYLYCNPPGRRPPADHVWVYRNGRLRPVTTVRGNSADVSLMTW